MCVRILWHVFFIENKNQGMPLNPLMTSMNAMNDKSVLNMMSNFDDPVEHQLASLEQLECKLDD